MVQIPKPNEMTPDERRLRDQLGAATGILHALALSLLTWLILALIVAYAEGWF